MHLRTASAEAIQPQATVSYLEPPVSPTPINRPAPPVVAAPRPAPAAVQSSAPLASAQPPAQPLAPAVPASVVPPVQSVEPLAPPRDETVAVFLRLSSGQRVWAGRFDSDALANERANEIVGELTRPEPGVWPKFGEHLIRPEAVVSIEFSARPES
jgi:hypothetical protein